MAASPQTTADGSQTLYSERFGQTFHSHKGALSESRHVFLKASGVEERLTAGTATRVLEVGFGTGLNFFLSADAALGAGSSLSYCALERELLPIEIVQSLTYGEHLHQPALVVKYLEFRAQLPETLAAGSYRFEHGTVKLEILLGEATEQTLTHGHYDAVYQDAFSPDANPELWSTEFLTNLYEALKPGGVLTTYCVKGTVRRQLQTIGFDVHKLPGPIGGKREMLRAVK